MEARRPQVKLDPDIIAICKERKERELPLLHFGLVVDRKFLAECVRKHNLSLDDDLAPPHCSREPHIVDAVTEYLEKQCKFPLRLTYVLAKDKNLCVVALDNTQRLRSTTYGGWEKRIVPVLKVLRHELALRSNARAKWWWDHTCNCSYVLSLPRFPVDVNWQTGIYARCPSTILLRSTRRNGRLWVT